MLISLTRTALVRGWNPQVFLRLFLQLQDSHMEETAGSEPENALDAFMRLIEADHNPLLFEYVLIVLEDSKAAPTTKTFVKWLEKTHNTENRGNIKLFCAYVARSKSFTLSTSEREILKRLKSQDSQEAVILLNARLNNTLDGQLGLSTSLSNISLSSAIKHEQTDESDVANKNTCQPDPVTRLIWLEWMLNTGQNLCSVPEYFATLWPGDRSPVVGYEIVLTAFEVLTLSEKITNHRGEHFLCSRVPLILKNMEITDIDVVIARVLSTIDKSIVHRAEQMFPNICRRFGVACITLGLCKEEVLGSLHCETNGDLVNKDDELLVSINDIVFDPKLYVPSIPNMSLTRIASTSKDLVFMVSGASFESSLTQAISLQNIAALCEALLTNPSIADLVFVHASPHAFCSAICKHAEKLATTPHSQENLDQNALQTTIYTVLGTLITFLDFFKSRYNLKMPECWISSYISAKHWGADAFRVDKWTPDISKWIVSLFSNNGGRVQPAMLLPFQDLAYILPAVERQAIWAYRSAVLDKESFKSGLEKTFGLLPVNLFGPLLLRVAETDYFINRHPSATVDCSILYLNRLMTLQSANTVLCSLAIGPKARKLAELSNSAELQKLADKIMQRIPASNSQNVAETNFTNANTPKAASLASRSNSLNGLNTAGQKKTSLLERLSTSVKILSRWNVWPHGVPPRLSDLLMQSRGIIKLNKLFDMLPKNLRLSMVVAVCLYKLDPHFLHSELCVSELSTECMLAQSLNELGLKLEQDLLTTIADMHEHDIELDLSSISSSVKQTVKTEPIVAKSANATPVPENPASTMLTDDQFDKVDLYDEFVNQPMDLEDLDMAMADDWN